MLQADVTSHQSGREGCLAFLHQPLLSQPRGTFCSLVLGSIQRNKNTFYCCTPWKKQVGESNAQNCCRSGGLLVYQSWVLEEKKNMIPKAQPCVLHTLMVSTASSASRLSKTGKDDKKWWSLTEMNMHWSENSSEGEVKDRTGQVQEKRRHTGRAFAC